MLSMLSKCIILFILQETSAFPQLIMKFLEDHYEVFHPNTRKVIVQSLILMRNKRFIEPIQVLTLFFKLFRAQDKYLREIVYNHIVSDVVSVNQKKRNEQVNNKLQALMYTMLADNNPTAARMSLKVMTTLYRRQVLFTYFIRFGQMLKV